MRRWVDKCGEIRGCGVRVDTVSGISYHGNEPWTVIKNAVFVGCLNDHCLLKCALLHGHNSSGDNVWEFVKEDAVSCMYLDC